MDIYRSKKEGTFAGKPIAVGDYFGYDQIGRPFVATRIVRAVSHRMKIWRLNPRRGWLLGWERSETTRAVLRHMLDDGREVEVI